MFDFLGNNSVWSLVLQGDVMTKFVLFVLLGMSIGCWAITLYKMVLFNIKKQQFAKMLQELKTTTQFSDLFAATTKHAKTVPGYFLSSCLSHLKELLMIKNSGEHDYARGKGLEFLQMQIDQTVDELVAQEASYLSFLSVSAAASPLLGLFGTVWGLVHSFIDISQKQSADIVTVAPGIAEALITTLAGLLVAIPSLMLFYFLSSKVKDVEKNLYALSDKFMVISRQLVLEKSEVSSAIVGNEFLMPEDAGSQDQA